jgi:hypothetical protein
MKYIIGALIFSIQLFGYEFILLNSTTIEDDVIVENIVSQINNNYFNEENKIEFKELENKEDILNLMKEIDFTGDPDELKTLIAEHEDLEDDLNLIYKTKYFLIVSQNIDREGRDELKIVLKVDNVDYFDSEFIMPRLEDKEAHYVDTIANVVLTYISYKDKNFIKVHQL